MPEEDLVTNAEPQVEQEPAGETAVPPEQTEAAEEEVVDYRKQFEEADKRYKQLQSSTQKTIEKLQKAQRQTAAPDTTRLDRIEEALALTLDRLAAQQNEESPFAEDKKTNSFYEDWKKRKETEDSQRQYGEYAQGVKDNMDVVLEENNLDWDHPELKKILEEPNIAVAQSKFTRAIGKILKANRETELKSMTEAAVTNAKKALVQAGVLKLSTGPSAGSGMADNSFLAEYAKGNRNSEADHAKARDILANL